MNKEILYENILNTLLKSIDAGVHIVDEKGNTLFYNDAMSELEGISSEYVLGKNILEIFPSLNNTTSTLLHVMETKKAKYDLKQSYLNNQGQQVDTINTTLPIIIGNKLGGAIEIAKNVTKEERMNKQLEYLKTELATIGNEENGLSGYMFRNLIGSSPSFLKVIEIAKRAATSPSTVFIYGETGTGKEIFAQSIHNAGNRSNKPFIAQNCAALPESLLEGILFGTEKGSFTGAVSRAGLFEQAEGGTLLLDEINSMPISLQSKLLRVLQENTVRRLGGMEDIKLNVRIIATTNEDPLEMIKKGTLRKDLFYRLNVISIHIPPLRERTRDIPVLIEAFIKKYNALLNKDVWDVEVTLKEALMNYHWQGNIRELKNVIESAMNMIITEHLITIEHLNQDVVKQLHINKKNKEDSKNVYKVNSIHEYINSKEYQIVAQALTDAKGNISLASRSLGISRQNLQYKMKKFNLKDK